MISVRAPSDRAAPVVWVLTGVAALAGAALYLNAYRVHNMQPVGWDIFGYIWQTRAAGHGALSGLGARPGVPLLASLIASIVPLSASRELVVLPIVMAVGLALAAGAAVRAGLGVRHWFLPVLVATVLLWPGTGRTLVGYEGSLLLLMLLAAGIAVLVHADGRPLRLAGASLLLLGAALSHVAIFAAFVAVAGLFVVLSLPAFLSDRRSGVPLLATDAGGAAAGVLGATAAGAGLLFGAIGLRPGDSLHTNTVSFLFGGRTWDEIRRVRPPATLPAAAIGATAAVCAAYPEAPDDGLAVDGPAGDDARRPARSMLRWGLAWLVVAAVGVLLSLRGYAVPGGRFLLFALPLPLLVGLGLATVALLGTGCRLGWRAAVAALLIVGILAGLGRQGYRFIQYQYVQTSVALANELNAAATYVRSLPPGTSVVVAVDQPGASGAYTPKLRQNVIRSAMPAEAITRTYVFVGRPEDLLAGRPTLLPAGPRWHQAYNAASRLAWSQAQPALRAGAVALVLQRYNPAGYARSIASDPSRWVAAGVYALRGPVDRVAPPARAGPFPVASAVLWGLCMFGLLVLAGWGFASALLPPGRASALDVVCLSPAVGAGAAVLAAFAIAVAGGDPAGPLGIVALAGIAVAGLIVRGRRRRRARPVAGRVGDDGARGADPAGDGSGAGSGPTEPSTSAGILDPA